MCTEGRCGAREPLQASRTDEAGEPSLCLTGQMKHENRPCAAGEPPGRFTRQENHPLAMRQENRPHASHEAREPSPCFANLKKFFIFSLLFT